MCAARVISQVTLLLSLAAPCLAGDGAPEMETDRPDRTETASVVPFGAIQFEGGAGFERDVAADDSLLLWSSTTISYPSMLFRYGALEWAELRVGFDYGVLARRLECPECAGISRPAEGSDLIGAISIGTKVALVDGGDGGTNVAAIAEVAAPPAEPERVEPALVLSVDHALSERFRLGYNVGGSWDREVRGISWEYSSSLGMDITGSVGGYLELFGQMARDRFPEHSFDLGITLAGNSNLQFDLEGGVGLSPAAPDYFVDAGVSFRLLR